MTATRLEPARKRHGLNLTFFAAGLRDKFLRGPNVAAGLPAARILDTQTVPQKRDSEKRQTDTLKTLQNGFSQQPNLAYEISQWLVATTFACRRKRPCMLEFPNSLPESWIKIGIHQ